MNNYVSHIKAPYPLVDITTNTRLSYTDLVNRFSDYIIN